MKRHEWKPTGGLESNPGTWDNGNGGLIFVEECACGMMRKSGKDYTGQRPGNTWGPHYFDAKGRQVANAGPCYRREEAA